MAEEVKTEVEEGNLSKTTQLIGENFISPGEEDVTLVQLSLAPPSPVAALPLPVSSCSVVERTEKRVKIKRRFSDSKIKRAITGHAGKCVWQNKAATDKMITPGQTKLPAMIRAEEIQSNLESTFPSFVKFLVRSHVGICFWMGLPGSFCRAHLPQEDATVTLEDEIGKEFRMKYIAYKTGLSAGWRQFSVAHHLLVGDVLVFQLTDHCRFKVYIIRANDLAEVDGALGLLTLHPQIKQSEAEDNAEITVVAGKRTKRKRPRSLPLAVVQKKNKSSGRLSVPKTWQVCEQSEGDSEEVGSEVLEGLKLALPAVQFEDIKSFENFNIVVDGLVLDSELPEDVRRKYYNLCCSQNAFLHVNLIKGINLKLIAGIISETVCISDAMRACNLTTSREEFDAWDKTLKASQQFGMNVGFLRDRLSRLVSLAYDSESATKTRRCIEATNERVRIETEMRNLEAKLVELKAAHKKYGLDIESLKSKAESYELKFEEEVLAPW